MSVKKKFLKSRPVCKCTFTLPKEAAPAATRVTLAGEFNDWNTDEIEMRPLKSGVFKAELDLPVGQSYQYKFLIDGQRWENDWDAEQYVPAAGIGADNSLVSV